MVRPDKAAAVAELSTQFRDSSAVVLTEYRGLTVKQLGQLRTELTGNATYIVVKNTLTRIAAAQAGVTAFDGMLTGPSAAVFVTGDPVVVAKSLREFARTNAALVIKGGLLDGRSLTTQELSQLADLESREVLLAKLAGAFQALPQRTVSLLAAPLSQAARVLDALRARLAENAPVDSETAIVTTADEPEQASPAAADATPQTTDVSDVSEPTDVSDVSEPTDVSDVSEPTDVTD